MGNYAQAIEHCEQAFAVEGDTRDSVAALSTRIMLGRLRPLTGDQDAARTVWREAHAALQRLHHPRTSEVAQLLADLDAPAARDPARRWIPTINDRRRPGPGSSAVVVW